MQTNPDTTPLFSILIPSWNNLPFLQLCVESIRKNSTFTHQIIVHVNEGTDGTLEWVQSQGLDYSYSEKNVGVCLAMNSMRPLVSCQYMFYLNDDMYLLPAWDEALYAEVKSLPDNKFFLSGTMIQPHNHLDVGVTADYGDTVESFHEGRLLAEYKQYTMEDWCGATWPPNLVHRDIWDLVGGYSIEYTPGMYSDPDFTAKLWMAGVRYLKGVASCRVYHFETKSTGRIKRNNGALQFLLKWGITNSTIRKKMTGLGKPWSSEKMNGKVPQMLRFKARLKAVFELLKGSDWGSM